MEGSPSGPTICRTCGATLSPLAEFCKTCHAFDQWQLAVDTNNVKDLLKVIKEEDVQLVVNYAKRLKERARHVRNIPASKKRTPREFDFALQEIEKTTRGLELTSIEAVGVLEMVKQSFIEEMFYEDYTPLDDDPPDEKES